MTKSVRKIEFLLGDAVIRPPTGEREYFFEAVGANNHARFIPITFNRVGVLSERLTKIEDGDLHEAFILHWIAGRGGPDQSERCEYPWWSSYFDRMASATCIMCRLPLGEDRAVSRACWHQACTACASYETVAEWNAVKRMTKCYKCQKDTRYYIFNGEQCNDERSHSDAIIFEIF